MNTETADAQPAPAAPGGVEYAGFWIRLGAYLIDLVILTAVTLLLAFAIITLSGASTAAIWDSTVIWDLSSLLSLAVGAVYFPVFQASAMQATPGKRAVGLKVTDAEGNRISLMRALGRYLASFVSAILYIGFIMIAFTDRKRGLHDMIAGTLVVKRQ